MYAFMNSQIKNTYMKQNFTHLYALLAALFFSTGLLAQISGDYQTANTGNWSAIATWQTWNGTSWVAASAAPSSSNTTASNVVTILNGHTVTLDASVTANKIVINSGGTLSVNNAGDLTLVHNTSPDLTVTGTLNLGNFHNINVSGAATIQMNGTFTMSSGTLNATTTTGASSVTTVTGTNTDKNFGANFTNGGTFHFQCNSGNTAGALLLNGPGLTFTNATGAVFDVEVLTDKGFGGGTANNFVNNGTINMTTAFNLRISSTFTNTGLIQGQLNGNVGGIINTGSPANGAMSSNTGTISPGDGTHTGIMTMEPTMFTGKTPTININILSTGAVAGTNYDQLVISGAVNMAGNKLTATNAAGATDAVGTNFTIVSLSSGSPTGPFSSVTKSSNLSAPAFNAANITMSKITPLPLTWAGFSAQATGSNEVSLNWSTFSEQNTSRFVVNYSTNGSDFHPIGTVAAAGNSETLLRYSFVHNNPDLNGPNFYQLQEFDLDGRINYSKVQVVRFNGGQIVKLLAGNPVHDKLTLSVQEDGVNAILVDAVGRTLRTWILRKGTQDEAIGDLPTGGYELVIYQNQQRVDAKHIIKL